MIFYLSKNLQGPPLVKEIFLPLVQINIAMPEEAPIKGRPSIVAT